MRRALTAALFALPLVAAASPAAAQAPKAPEMTYKVSIGGMNAGIFKTLLLPTHKAIIQGDNVAVSEIKKAVDKTTRIAISGGKVSSFMLKKLTAMMGQQMTVEIMTAPIGLKPGQRCTFVLEDAFLEKAEPTGLVYRPSELPDYTCK